MASSTNWLSFLCVFVVNVVLMIAINNTASVGAAEEFKVGEGVGWHQPDPNHTHFYTLWASRMRFHVRDSLRFVYKNDSVMVVDKWAYYHCNSSSPTSVFNDGNTLVILKKPGPMYFISGDPEHCEAGLKLFIDVLELHPRSHSPPAIPSPHKPKSDEEAPAPAPSSNSGLQVSVPLASTVVVAFIALLTASG